MSWPAKVVAWVAICPHESYIHPIKGTRVNAAFRLILSLVIGGALWGCL